MLKSEKIVVVNSKDHILGIKDKDLAHDFPGALHRAISVWVVDAFGKILITQRSSKKKLWPGYWSNTVCSHPRLGESYKKAGERRLYEELGFKTSLAYLYKFRYEAKYRDVGLEKELCGVLVGKYRGDVFANSNEVADHKWVGWGELGAWILKSRDKFTPWFFMEKERLGKDKRFMKLINKAKKKKI